MTGTSKSGTLESTGVPRLFWGVRRLGCTTSAMFIALLLMPTMNSAQWTEPELLPPPINVDPPGSYYYSTISADGRLLCITIYPGQYGDDDVYFSERLTDSTWTRPANAGPNINNNQRNLSPSITNDRQTLYYVSYDGDYRIYQSHRTGSNWDDWSAAVPLPEPVNRGFQFTGQISFDDSTLVFTSQGQPGILHGRDAMYESRLQPDGSWSEPHLLSFHLNILNGSLHPCLTDSGQVVIYGMFGGTNRHFDIFYAFRNDTGFGPAFRCDSTINTSFWDSGPSCPADGSLLYFESRRPVNGDTTLVAKLYVARRVPLTALNRRCDNSNYREGILITPTTGGNGTIFKIQVSDRLKGQVVCVYNILGQRVDLIIPASRLQTNYLWKGENNGTDALTSGTYFVAVPYGHGVALGRITFVK